MAVEIFVVKNPPLRCNFRNYALLLSAIVSIKSTPPPCSCTVHLSATGQTAPEPYGLSYFRGAPQFTMVMRILCFVHADSLGLVMNVHYRAEYWDGIVD